MAVHPMGQAEGGAHKALWGLGDPPWEPHYRRFTRTRPHLTGPQAGRTRCHLRALEGPPQIAGAEASCSALHREPQAFGTDHGDMSCGHRAPHLRLSKVREQASTSGQNEVQGAGFAPHSYARNKLDKIQETAASLRGPSSLPEHFQLWCREGTPQVQGSPQGQRWSWESEEAKAARVCRREPRRGARPGEICRA